MNTENTSNFQSDGPLAGVRALDFGQYVAGPLAALLLSEQGADVVHIDPPGGPRWTATANAYLMRGRRRIELDLKTAEGRVTAERLIGASDVVIEGFRPGVMNRLGIGPSMMLAAHQHLIYCSIPGFGSDDPRAAMPGWEGVVAASMGTYAGPEDREPAREAFTALPIASTLAGIFTAIHAVAALLARDRDGRGQAIEVALHDAMFEVAARHLTRLPWPMLPIVDPHGFGLYECQDGRWISWQSSNGRFLHWLADVAGASGLRLEGLAEPELLLNNPMLQAELRRQLAAIFASRPAFVWEAEAGKRGVPIAAVRTLEEWMTGDVARQAKLVVPVDDPELGPTWQPNRVVTTRPIGDQPVPARQPYVSAREVTAEWSGPRDLPELADEDPRPVLDGIRVLDLAHVVAGPTMGRILTEFGANVIKVSGPRDRHLDHYNLNRGKRTVSLDLADGEARALLDGLIARADVLTHSFSQGAMDRMGYPIDDLVRDYPGLIVSALTAYTENGPWADRRGYEHQAQACSGMMARYGGLRSPEKQTYVINDHGAGLLGSFGILAALYGRGRDGTGAAVKTSLAQISLLHQGIFAVDYVGRPPEPEGTLASPGYGPDHRIYQAKDGNVFIGGLAVDEDTVSTLSVAECVARFSTKTCGVHGLRKLEQIRTDPINVERGRLAMRDIPGRGTPMSVVAPVARVTGPPLVTGWFPNPPGYDRAAVEAEIDEVAPRSAQAVR